MPKQQDFVEIPLEVKNVTELSIKVFTQHTGTITLEKDVIYKATINKIENIGSDCIGEIMIFDNDFNAKKIIYVENSALHNNQHIGVDLEETLYN